MNLIPGADNPWTEVIVDAAGAAIPTGTAVLKFYALDGANAGKWYNAGTGTWDATTQNAASLTHLEGGIWTGTIPAAACIEGVNYLIYVSASEAEIPLKSQVTCEYPVTANASGQVVASNAALANLDAAVSSRSSHSAADVWAAVTRTLTAVPTGAALEATLTAIKGAGWTAETLKALKDAIDLLATAANLATVDTVVDAIKAKTDNLPATPANETTLTAHTATLAALQKLAEADQEIDITATPYNRVWKDKDTGDELLRKALTQADGSDVTSTDHLVANEDEVE